MPPDPHGPPVDLDTTGKALYRKLRNFLKAQDSWSDSDKFLLGETCRAEMLARTARSALPKTPAGVPVLVSSGYKGQEVAHPLVKVADAAGKTFVEGLKELGLTPRARKQLAIEMPYEGGKFGGGFGDGLEGLL